MVTNIPATRLYLPSPPPRAVLRPRLAERLNAGLQRKLALVSAPAGFGKTTLVSEWVSGCGRPVAWLSLEESDSDLARFLSGLIAALQRLPPGGRKGAAGAEGPMPAAALGERVLAALQSPQPPPAEALLTALVNEIDAIPVAFVLVLDDLHLAHSDAVDAALNFLVLHLPERMHLVIVTRQDPPLPLARLRARGQLCELRAADLRFTPEEAAAFLNQAMGLALSRADVAALEQRTEGWIAGLQLASLALQAQQAQQGEAVTASFIQAFSGSHRFVLDYLIEEVLQGQPAEVRRFLLHTSVLDRLCAGLCERVAGQPDGQARLEALERGNLFLVPLDERRQWYRYHPLFASVLQARLLEEQPDLAAELHRRASAWYQENGLPQEAIRHALAGKDFERAASLLELAWPAMDVSYQSAAWLGWVRLLPEPVLQVRPVLCLGYAWALLDAGEMEGCETYLQQAEAWLEKPGPTPPALLPAGGGSLMAGASLTADAALTGDAGPTPPAPLPAGGGSSTGGAALPVVADLALFQSLPAAIATARAYRALALGEIAEAADYARRALDLTPADDTVRRIQGTALLGLAQFAGGDLEAAGQSYTEFQAGLLRSGDILTATGISFVLAEIRLAQGRLRAAISAYQQALRLATGQGGAAPIGTADLYRGLAELCCEQGDLDAAAAHLATAKKLGEGASLTAWDYRLYVAEARLQAAHGRLDEALSFLDQAERWFVRSPIPNLRPIPALKARIWIRKGALAQAEDWARDQGLDPEGAITFLHAFEYITLARLLAARAENAHDGAAAQAAGRLLDRLLDAAQAGGWGDSRIEILVVQARLQQALFPSAQALAQLRQGLALAGPEGYVQLFVDEGEPLLELLERLSAAAGKQPGSEPGAGHLDRLLRAMRKPARPRAAPSLAQPLVEPLSERELEVLRLLRSELSGPEIAGRLVVSVNTLRTHTKNIYSKLGVNNRRAAVRRAEQLGLI